jgi:hypothetical protein
MTREDITRMAREAGFPDYAMGLASEDAWQKTELFAALVAAAEREAILAVIEAYKVPVGNSAAGEMACEWTMDALRDLRDAIRARGSK